jgi:hypothetical protein
MKWIEISEALGHGYPECLDSGREIAKFIVWLDPDYDEEAVADAYDGCTAVLQRLPAAALSTEDYHQPFAYKHQRYAKLPSETAPPLLVRDGIIIDGNHRFRVGLQKGQTHFLCYVIRQD